MNNKNLKKEAKNKKKQTLTGTIEDYPLVEVKWFDATGDSGWMDIKKALATKPARPVSLGYKLYHTKEKLIIFTDYIVDDEDGSLTVGNVTTIPAAWIQDVTEIVFTNK
tara:strand:- start:919 stop:1245 length:327 start_codon:yes stop_codon:yes gene_type:complete